MTATTLSTLDAYNEHMRALEPERKGLPEGETITAYHVTTEDFDGTIREFIVPDKIWRYTEFEVLFKKVTIQSTTF